MEKRDAHIHTPFCPHGSKDALKQYVEKALERGFDSITFTEHAPPSSREGKKGCGYERLVFPFVSLH